MTEEKENNIIKTVDENGEEFTFELIDIVKVDEQDYGLLIYLDEEDGDSEEEELVIMKLSKEEDEEGYSFEMIEDDEEFNNVIAFLEQDTEE